VAKDCACGTLRDRSQRRAQKILEAWKCKFRVDRNVLETTGDSLMLEFLNVRSRRDYKGT
jgi:hypothetical protein